MPEPNPGSEPTDEATDPRGSDTRALAAGVTAADAEQPVEPPEGSPVYLSGLDLRGRRVLVVGGGTIATRRLPRLLDAGALVEVVAPRASQEVQELAAAGRLVWHQREARADDVTGAWYVVAAADDHGANALVGERALAEHVFCVRADRAFEGTAWTPTVESAGRYTVGVLGNRDPRASVALRRRLVEVLREWVSTRG